MTRILIVDDERIIRGQLKKLLLRYQYDVSDAESVEEVIDQYDDASFDLVITDLRLPGAPGTELINHFKSTPVMVMTSYASVRSAVDTMRSGAIHYIAKPFEHDELLAAIDRAVQAPQANNQSQPHHPPAPPGYPIEGIVGSCESMKQVFNILEKVSPTDSTVLIVGESGTGKELIARAVHQQSARATGPIITVNCAAIPEGLIETELFGHEKGAFTGATQYHKGLVEAADAGTLFLDEIGELPLEAQARLLRVLQEKETRRVGSTQAKKVDIRLIAATHRDLRQLIKEQKFREDLYFRLHVVEIVLPPLRERTDDIEPLAIALLERTCNKLNRQVATFSPNAMSVIKAYSWPGNIREMENAIERAVIMSDHDEIEAELLAIEVDKSTEHDKISPQSELTQANLSLESYFKQFVLANQDKLSETELAKQLGISRKSLWEKRQKLGISKPKKTSSD